MENFRVKWSAGGEEHTSAVAYDRATAEERKAELEQQDDVSAVRIVPTKPGE